MATHSSILAGESHGPRSLAGYSAQDCRESNTTDRLTHTYDASERGCVGGQQSFYGSSCAPPPHISKNHDTKSHRTKHPKAVGGGNHLGAQICRQAVSKKKGYLLIAPWMSISGRINVGHVIIAVSYGPVQVMGMNHSGIRRKRTKSEARQETEIEYKRTFLEGIRFVKLGLFFKEQHQKGLS